MDRKRAYARSQPLANTRVDTVGRVQKLGGRHRHPQSQSERLVAFKRAREIRKNEGLVGRMLPIPRSSSNLSALADVAERDAATNKISTTPILFGQPWTGQPVYKRDIFSASVNFKDNTAIASKSGAENISEDSVQFQDTAIASMPSHKDVRKVLVDFKDNTTEKSQFSGTRSVLFGQPSTAGNFLRFHDHAQSQKPSLLVESNTTMSVVCRETTTHFLGGVQLEGMHNGSLFRNSTLSVPVGKSSLSHNLLPDPPISSSPTIQRKIGRAEGQTVRDQRGTERDMEIEREIEREIEISRRDVEIEIKNHRKQGRSVRGYMSISRGDLRRAHGRSLETARQSITPEFTSLVELRLLQKLQNIVEEALYYFGKKYMTNLLLQSGWDCPQVVELNSWEIPFRKSRLPIHALAPDTTPEDVLICIEHLKYIRNSAVHRLRPGLKIIRASMPRAVLLAQFLRDEERAGKLKTIQRTLMKPDFTELNRILGISNTEKVQSEMYEDHTPTRWPIVPHCSGGDLQDTYQRRGTQISEADKRKKDEGYIHGKSHGLPSLKDVDRPISMGQGLHEKLHVKRRRVTGGYESMQDPYTMDSLPAKEPRLGRKGAANDGNRRPHQSYSESNVLVSQFPGSRRRDASLSRNQPVPSLLSAATHKHSNADGLSSAFGPKKSTFKEVIHISDDEKEPRLIIHIDED